MQMILCLRTNMIYHQTEFSQNMETIDKIIRLILKSNLKLIDPFFVQVAVEVVESDTISFINADTTDM